MAEVELPNPAELGERRDKAFSRNVALTTAIYAVVLAIASLGGSHAMKEMLLAQQQASDQWAFYQAKVVREHLNRAQKLTIEAQLAEPSGVRAGERAKLEALAKQFGAEEMRLAADKKDIEREARRLEKERDHARDRDPYFEYAEVFLQIAIVTASVSILAGSRLVFGFSLVLAVLGALTTINGFALVTRLPFLHTLMTLPARARPRDSHPTAPRGRHAAGRGYSVPEVLLGTVFSARALCTPRGEFIRPKWTSGTLYPRPAGRRSPTPVRCGSPGRAPRAWLPARPRRASDARGSCGQSPRASLPESDRPRTRG